MAGKDDRPGISAAALIWGATILGVLAVIGAALLTMNAGKGQQRTAAVIEQVPFKTSEVKTVPVSVMPESPAAESTHQAVVAKPVTPAVPQSGEKPQLKLDNLAGTLRLHMPDVKPGDRLPLEHTCYRKNQSPTFEWSGAPLGTQSLAAVFERQEKGKEPAWIWILFDIDPAAGKVSANVPHQAELPGGMRQAKNIYNNAEYTGPCEPRGQIPYALRLFALDTKLALPGGTSRDDLVRAMNGHVIDAADYTVVHYFRF